MKKCTHSIPLKSNFNWAHYIVFSVVVSVNFGSPTYTIPEDGESVEVCLTTNVGSNEPLTLIVLTDPRTATGEFTDFYIFHRASEVRLDALLMAFLCDFVQKCS